MKGGESGVSATSATIVLTVRGLPAIFEVMIISASASLSDINALTSMAADIARLPDEELVDLVVSWRLRARRGDKEAFGPAHALEVEHRRRQSTPSVVVNPAFRTIVTTRPWWKVWGRRGAGQLVTFR